jgi:hypothetical protein
MTSLKCLNSGVESNDAAFILSSEHRYVSRVPGAFEEEVLSSNLLSLASEFLVRHAAAHNLFHNGGESLCVRGLPVVIAESLLVEITE